MSRIIVHIEGGCVQAVYSDDKNVKVQLADWDNANCDDEAKEDCDRLQVESGRMHCVF